MLSLQREDLVFYRPDKASLYQKGKYRHRFSLNDDDKVLVYVGRHSSIKGYDRLKNNADFFQKNQINLICAGEYDDQSIPQKMDL